MKHIQLYFDKEEYTSDKSLKETLKSLTQHFKVTPILKATNSLPSLVSKKPLKYKKQYARQISQTITMPVYPYTHLYNKVLPYINTEKPTETKNISSSFTKIIYAHNWTILSKISISADNVLFIHIHNLPENIVKDIHKILFDEAKLIFVANEVIKDHIRLYFDINPYKIVIINNKYEKTLPRFLNSEFKTEHKTIILGDYIKFKNEANNLVKHLINQVHTPIFFGKGRRLQPLIDLFSRWKKKILFFDHLDLEIWKTLHKNSSVYSLNLEDNSSKDNLKLLSPNNFNEVNFKIMCYDIEYHIREYHNLKTRF